MERLGWLLKRQLSEGDCVPALRTVAWMLAEAWQEHRRGIRSEGKIPQEELSGAAEGQSYEALSYAALRNIFQRIAPSSAASNDVFLDAGCGMGRVLHEAARHPYHQVFGFDISPRLIRQAGHNLAVPDARRHCRDISLSVADARTFTIPAEVTTVFLFNPFRGSVMEGFMRQLTSSCALRPRSLKIVVANPVNFPAALLPGLVLLDRFDVFHPRMERRHEYRLPVHIYQTV